MSIICTYVTNGRTVSCYFLVVVVLDMDMIMQDNRPGLLHGPADMGRDVYKVRAYTCSVAAFYAA